MTDLLHVKVKGRTPSRPWRYVFPEDGHVCEGFHYWGWCTEIEQHYQRNGYAKPANWLEIAEDQLCRLLYPGECAYPTGNEPTYFINQRMTLEDVFNGTKVLAAWVTSGFPLVEREVAEERANTCAACWANLPIPGCASCSHIMEAVMDAVGNKQVSSGQLLYNKSCGFCHCASSANIWIPIEVSRHGVSPEVMNESPNWCWKKKALNELLAKEALLSESP